MKINSEIILAIPKGRIAKEITSLLSSLNLNPEKGFFEEDKNRKLLFKTNTKNFFLTKVRNFDVPTIVAFGGADFGIVGSDVINEFDYEEIYSPIDLKLGKCSMVLAKKKNDKIDPDASIVKVASKYPSATQNFFENKGKQVECVKLNGSIEIAPQLGISEMIVDLVSTGKTLKENNLEIVEKISDISSNLIVNRASLKTKSDDINKIIELFEKEIL
ncbi:MAG: ATP phosphoribosyltransferase [Alphaproteobacteria bacterium MarineAlpha6_Bin4]|nr:MAG: ATP phosphoribosyltransferase [Alphaproteobacteria bacterium MarineAlpha6_Bin3]PPR38510.1 MAG: ATP phosphoribosyltransferase [Alphaproteobacteria bacterium MarineAlpha6_Bin4]|tara:strand:+ start:2366 stop:3016 length:651 start_codon:yes stop_codon:yes gene_type:complete